MGAPGELYYSRDALAPRGVRWRRIMHDNFEEVKERNKRNLKFRGRLKIQLIACLAIVPYGLIGGSIYINICKANPDLTTIATWLLVAGCVAWVAWVIVASTKICCPHCNHWIGRSDPWNIPSCPYCKTSLKIQEYCGREKL